MIPKKLILIVIVLLSLDYQITDQRIAGWERMQDPNLRELVEYQKKTKLVGAMAARKPIIPWIMNLKFVRIPDIMTEDKINEFIKQNQVDYIFWGAFEQRYLKNLNNLSWIRGKLIWIKQGYGFIVEINYE